MDFFSDCLILLSRTSISSLLLILLNTIVMKLCNAYISFISDVAIFYHEVILIIFLSCRFWRPQSPSLTNTADQPRAAHMAAHLRSLLRHHTLLPLFPRQEPLSTPSSHGSHDPFPVRKAHQSPKLVIQMMAYLRSLCIKKSLQPLKLTQTTGISLTIISKPPQLNLHLQQWSSKSESKEQSREGKRKMEPHTSHASLSTLVFFFGGYVIHFSFVLIYIPLM